jgi:hypothetical protein
MYVNDKKQNTEIPHSAQEEIIHQSPHCLHFT